jgi:hypothetical protein
MELVVYMNSQTSYMVSSEGGCKVRRTVRVLLLTLTPRLDVLLTCPSVYSEPYALFALALPPHHHPDNHSFDQTFALVAVPC